MHLIKPKCIIIAVVVIVSIRFSNEKFSCDPEELNLNPNECSDILANIANFLIIVFFIIRIEEY